MSKLNLPPHVRRWVYLVALAVLPLLIAYGILDESQAPLWIALLGAIFVPGLAARNTPTSDPAQPADEPEIGLH